MNNEPKSKDHSTNHILLLLPMLLLTLTINKHLDGDTSRTMDMHSNHHIQVPFHRHRHRHRHHLIITLDTAIPIGLIIPSLLHRRNRILLGSQLLTSRLPRHQPPTLLLHNESQCSHKLSNLPNHRCRQSTTYRHLTHQHQLRLRHHQLLRMRILDNLRMTRNQSLVPLTL
jgi:hypothetical protein